MFAKLTGSDNLEVDETLTLLRCPNKLVIVIDKIAAILPRENGDGSYSISVFLDGVSNPYCSQNKLTLADFNAICGVIRTKRLDKLKGIKDAP